jgi:UDP-glucose 4-epimerase
MNLLLTGGTGYIGSHAAVVMVEAGHQVVLFDNLCNSKPDVVQRLEKITGKVIPFVEGDVRDTALLEKTLRDYKVDAVIHFAGLKAVAESVKNPIEYYANNVQSSISLLQAMRACNLKKIVFSSSATVYGEPQYLPYDENHPTNPINPYGRSKLQTEQILRDLCDSDFGLRVAILRYFNPMGAHESGLIGEDPKGTSNNLMPILNKVASGELPHLEIYGHDYPTEDGTPERDYIHVVDLVEGHLAALNYLEDHDDLHVFNLGTAKPISVLSLIRQYEFITGKIILNKKSGRRKGDLSSYYASIDRAKLLLYWSPKRSIGDMCKSSFNSFLVQCNEKTSKSINVVNNVGQ